jgi:hypothetical protein
MVGCSPNLQKKPAAKKNLPKNSQPIFFQTHFSALAGVQ